MKILAIADVEQSWLTTGFDPERLRGVNMIISCGDLPARYLEHVVTMANLPLLYVPGNHDTAYRAHAPEGCDSIDGRIREVAGVRIMGTGRSDFPNQINNVLAFPGIFRGALDVRASDINDEMKIAAAEAIASVIPESELTPEYIIPDAFNPNVKDAVAAAVRAAAKKTGVARI